MLIIPHVLLGAALGSEVGNVPGQAAVAFGVGWASHYVLDALPHWERLYGRRSNFKINSGEKWPVHIWYQGLVDAVLAILILGMALYFRGSLTSFEISPIFWGAVGAMMPDLLDNMPFWNKYLHQFKIFQWHYKFHVFSHITEEQTEKFPEYVGLLTQLIIIGGSLWLLLK
ncbi:MAG TPA: hypothetical protein VMQ44_00610 [Candidatus Saccharimonadales bacterium]|nr:hypothetical protein [Candidatus Saccharimonadales bacterium]